MLAREPDPGRTHRQGDAVAAHRHDGSPHAHRAGTHAHGHAHSPASLADGHPGHFTAGRPAHFPVAGQSRPPARPGLSLMRMSLAGRALIAALAIAALWAAVLAVTL